MKHAVSSKDDPEPIVLHPCPFCGANKLRILQDGCGIDKWVFCFNPGCYCSGPVRTVLEDAVMAWNKRSK